jgi:hypothetical protein
VTLLLLNSLLLSTSRHNRVSSSHSKPSALEDSGALDMDVTGQVLAKTPQQCSVVLHAGITALSTQWTAVTAVVTSVNFPKLGFHSHLLLTDMQL